MVTRGDRGLTDRELKARAPGIRLVLTDCDGVLTDGGVFYSATGEALKRFSVKDGHGVERLRQAGVATAIITRERSPAVASRAAKLELPFLFEGVRDKQAALARVLRTSGFERRELAFIGDDLNDLELLACVGAAGLTGAPADARPEVLRRVHYRSPVAGGAGAFRDFAEWILGLRDGRQRRQEEGP